MRTVVLYARSPDWREVVERADELMASPDFRVLKSEARTRAGFLDVPGADPAFIKRVEVSSWGRGVFERIRGSRAARSLAGAAMLKAHGLAHPEPLAAMDLYQMGAIRASYLVSRALVNADSLSRFMLGPGEIKGRNVHRRKQISDTVAAQIRRLHESGLYTRDLQETNIMVEDDGDGGFNVYFIDLEDFRRVANVSWKRRITNLVHLDRSIGRFLCRAARLDFLYSYLGRRPDRADARKIVAEVKAARESIDRRKRREMPATERVVAPLAGGTR
ncbi:lipopolysaccharide kinase InaA family protein [Candidatus Binatus sp.]|uniref:lipopolysaccharide kinase InaA family protein n=1 Tax=Candidatus Binatus sp. TaxID=2811406 RepID=UPI003BB0BA38